MEIESQSQPIQQPQQKENPSNNKQYATLNQYQIIDSLGKGYTAKVKLGLDTQTGKKVALKIMINKNIIQNLKGIQKEVQIMQGLNHPNIVNLIEVQDNGQYTKPNGQQKQVMFIAMELAQGGELFEYVAQTGTFSEVIARSYFHQLIDALEYCHGKGIAHRDLKPENLLFDDNFLLKVCDFGFATLIEGKDGSGLLHTVLGTESYMAPEIHERRPYKGIEVDLFASAIVLFIMYAGTPPFTKAIPKDPYYKLIATQKYSTFWQAHARYKQKGYYNDQFKDFITRMLLYDQSQRMTLDQLKQHPWYQGQVLTSQEMSFEFSQRRAKVEQEIQAEKLKKQLEKEKQKKQAQQQQQGFMYVAHQGFRSLNDTQNEFAGLDKEFPTLELKRELKVKYGNNKKLNDFYTGTDVEYLWKYVVKSAKDIFTTVKLNEKTYKLNCVKKTDNEEQVTVEVKISELNDEDLNCVEFIKLQGETMEYFNLVRSMNEQLAKIKVQTEQQEQQQSEQKDENNQQQQQV